VEEVAPWTLSSGIHALFQLMRWSGLAIRDALTLKRGELQHHKAKASTVRVSHKPDRNWTPKAYKEHEIPIPAKLVKKLKAWKAKSDKSCNLLFPTSGCNPKLDSLDGSKACAERAKLDKDNFSLHKFRSTFATRCLWAGVNLRRIQQWLGHSDMESTMGYLKPARN